MICKPSTCVVTGGSRAVMEDVGELNFSDEVLECRGHIGKLSYRMGN